MENKRRKKMYRKVKKPNNLGKHCFQKKIYTERDREKISKRKSDLNRDVYL